MSEVQKCRECGGDNLLWTQCNSNKTGVAEGRLRTHEITCSFVLGCEDCSETIAVISADKFITNFYAAQSELAALREELGTMTAAAKAVRDEWRVDQERLTAAEQRNASLVELLRDIEATMDAQEDSVSLGYNVECRMAAVLRPIESGASE